MKKTLAVLALVSLAGTFALAQEATLGTPVARAAEAKSTVRDFSASATSVTIEVSIQDASNNEIRVQSFSIPDAAHPSATVVGFLTAIGTIRATETGGVMRKANFRILGFLFDNGFLPGSTLAP